MTTEQPLGMTEHEQREAGEHPIWDAEVVVGKFREPGLSAMVLAYYSGHFSKAAAEKHAEDYITAANAMLFPNTEPAGGSEAVAQWRKAGTASWWDGFPDEQDSGGPYETRTLFTSAPEPAGGWQQAYTDEEVRDKLRDAATEHATKRKGSNGIRLWAEAHGVSHSRACEVLNGQRAPNDEVLAALGLARRIVPLVAPTAGGWQQEQEWQSRDGCVDSMTAERAAYFLRRFKGDEKMLGPHEQWALEFAIAALTKPSGEPQ